MSRRALLEAVRNSIRSTLNYAPEECDFGPPTGQPPAACGRWFCSVWAGSKSIVKSNGYAVEADYGVNLTLTRRMDVSFDRLGVVLADKGDFYDRLDDLAALVHRDQHDFFIGNAANRIIGDPRTGAEPIGFREGLRWLRDAQPRLVTGKWFGSDKPGVHGVACDLSCGRAVRNQIVQNVVHAEALGEELD